MNLLGRAVFAWLQEAADEEKEKAIWRALRKLPARSPEKPRGPSSEMAIRGKRRMGIRMRRYCLIVFG
jgi:hypothetical protein